MVTRRIAAAALLILGGGIAAGQEDRTEDRCRIDHLRTFAKLYGYVRFFHPSDEAAGIDQERLAIHGTRVACAAKDRDALVRSLWNLFSPIAHTVRIYDPLTDALPALRLNPDGLPGLKPVAWQHKGVGLGSGPIYASARTNRERRVQRGHGFGTITQGVDAGPYRGREIKLEAAVRTEVQGSGNQGQLWLRVDRPDRQTGFFDNMRDRPIKSPQWKTYEVIGHVDDDAERIVFGCFLKGTGKVWVDRIELLARPDGGEWEAVPVINGGFEEGEDAPIGWFAGSPGYAYEVAGRPAASEGERALLIQDESTTLAGGLFDDAPRPGDIVDKTLGSGLRARIPLALYADAERTLPEADPEALERLSRTLAGIDLDELTASDLGLRLGGVVITWNVLQHFYPYFDVVETDWDEVLTEALADALDDADPGEYLATLRRMVAELHDGHGNVFHPTEDRALPPFAAEWIEERPAITASEVPSEVRVGDVILEIDGEPAGERIERALEASSGSPQWKRVRALSRLGAGSADRPVRLKIERGGREMEVEVERSRTSPIPRQGPPIDEVRDGVYYVDLTRAEMSEIDARIEDLAAAGGVIFDLRGYPKGNHGVLQHLIDRPVRSAIWNVPEIVYPDRERITGWNRSGRWTLPPKEPRLRGRIAFVTDGRAISYAESVMGIVEHYRLGEIVGEPTAGTNGNVNAFELPGGFRVGWTGMKVLKHDGSQHHLVGIRPTVPATRTIEGLRAGRDELLEVALAVVTR